MPLTENSIETFIGALKDQYHIPFRVGMWENYTGQVRQPNAIQVQVDNDEQVCTVVRLIKDINRQQQDKCTLRAVAGWWNKEVNPCCFWRDAYENKHNESWSFSPGGIADIILLFSKKTHNVRVVSQLPAPERSDTTNHIKQLPITIVEASAEIQIGELADKLRSENLSLTTVCMIPHVSLGGALGTGVHGTGRDEEALFGAVRSVTFCDMDGNIRKMDRDHPDFRTLFTVHLGLPGILLRVELETVDAFNLEETIHLYPNVDAMIPDLPMLLEKQYFTLMSIPTYPTSLGIEDRINKLQVRTWQYTTDAPTRYVQSSYKADARTFIQELGTQAGGEILNYLMHPNFKELVPLFMLFTAALITESRGTGRVVDHENKITHAITAYPKQMRDVSYFLPVSFKNAQYLLADVAKEIERLLKEAGDQKECPLVLANYYRFLKGSTGGLSGTSTSAPDQMILALDIVTNPDAPGLESFERNFLAYLRSRGIEVRHHYGKNFPVGVHNYHDFLRSEVIEEHHQALERLCGGPDKLQSSPFLTSYYQEMLYAPAGQSVPQPQVARPQPDDDACRAFLPSLIAALGSMLIPESVEPIRAEFIRKCEEKISVSPLAANTADKSRNCCVIL